MLERVIACDLGKREIRTFYVTCFAAEDDTVRLSKPCFWESRCSLKFETWCMIVSGALRNLKSSAACSLKASMERT